MIEITGIESLTTFPIWNHTSRTDLTKKRIKTTLIKSVAGENSLCGFPMQIERSMMPANISVSMNADLIIDDFVTFLMKRRIMTKVPNIM